MALEEYIPLPTCQRFRKIGRKWVLQDKLLAIENFFYCASEVQNLAKIMRYSKKIETKAIELLPDVYQMGTMVGAYRNLDQNGVCRNELLELRNFNQSFNIDCFQAGIGLQWMHFLVVNFVKLAVLQPQIESFQLKT